MLRPAVCLVHFPHWCAGQENDICPVGNFIYTCKRNQMAVGDSLVSLVQLECQLDLSLRSVCFNRPCMVCLVL